MNSLNDACTQNNIKRKEREKIINHKKCKLKKKERKEKKQFAWQWCLLKYKALILNTYILFMFLPYLFNGLENCVLFWTHSFPIFTLGLLFQNFKFAKIFVLHPICTLKRKLFSLHFIIINLNMLSHMHNVIANIDLNRD